MALWDEVVLRYPAQTLAELTNARDATATTADGVKGGRAATAIRYTYFPMHAQLVYDGTNEMHVEVAVNGVIALLFRWGGSANSLARPDWDAWVEEAKALRDVTSRARIVPVTTSRLTPSEEAASGQVVRPAFDESHFASGRLNPPGEGPNPGIMP